MSRFKTVIASATGVITALVNIHLVNMFWAFILGFAGAAGGWLFTKLVTYIINKKNEK